MSFLDDDDLLDPHHIETLLSGSADLIYTWCRVTGRNWNPNSHFDASKLRRANYIPTPVLIRREVFLEAGGFQPQWRPREDWGLWLRLLDLQASFECIPEVTWTYRFQPDGMTYKES